MWHTFQEAKPESGKKICALYDDGSGAALYLVHDLGFIDHNGDDVEGLGDGHVKWAYVPDEFELWFELQDADAS